MKIAIVNGAPDDSWAQHETALETAIDSARARGQEIEYFKARDMEIKPCIGCFGCWIKTPGKCVIEDEHATILSSMINSDIILYATPITAGFVSSTTKSVIDRSIPMVLPYIDIIDGECHHPLRYDTVANRGVLLFDDGSLDAQAVELVYESFDRNALNFHSTQTYRYTVTPESMEVAIDEIINS